MTPRLVVILFGPPAAGKTTVARSLGLEVYDRDDAQWAGLGEREFRAAIDRLHDVPGARAVIIRRGATRSARSRTITSVAATHAFVMATPEKVCMERASARGRDFRRERGAIHEWWLRWDRGTDVPLWTGSWRPPIEELPDGTDAPALLGAPSRVWL